MALHFLSELRKTFAQHAKRPALIHRGQAVTYGELNVQARRTAAWLQGLGVQPGDRVVLLTADKRALLAANLGSWFAGGVPVPLNPRFTREELRFYLRDSAPRIVVAGQEQQQLVAELAAELPEPPQVVSDASVLNAPAAPWREPTVAPDDPCLILYSSGTTGWPKGVVHTQANVASSLLALRDCWQMTPDDVVVNVLPLFHIHGLAFATHLTWLAGGCLRLEDSFDPEQTMAAIGQATVFMAVPTMYYRLLDEPQFRETAQSWTRLRLATCGSAPIRPEVLPMLESILGRPVINRYGMTEAYVITSLPLAGPWPAGSVGQPLNGIDVLVRRDDGKSAAMGQVGSVALRGPNLFREYWRNPQATAAALTGGWFDTGDLGSLDEHGFLKLAGRKHDLIITDGYNVYPQVVERVINECPGVRECAVVGLADSRRGERVAVAVVKSDAALDEARLRAWCQERLVHYQQPRDIAFVNALPRNSLGKVLRHELCEQVFLRVRQLSGPRGR